MSLGLLGPPDISGPRAVALYARLVIQSWVQVVWHSVPEMMDFLSILDKIPWSNDSAVTVTESFLVCSSHYLIRWLHLYSKVSSPSWVCVVFVLLAWVDLFVNLCVTAATSLHPPQHPVFLAWCSRWVGRYCGARMLTGDEGKAVLQCQRSCQGPPLAYSERRHPAHSSQC